MFIDVVSICAELVVGELDHGTETSRRHRAIEFVDRAKSNKFFQYAVSRWQAQELDDYYHTPFHQNFAYVTMKAAGLTEKGYQIIRLGTTVTLKCFQDGTTGYQRLGTESDFRVPSLPTLTSIKEPGRARIFFYQLFFSVVFRVVANVRTGSTFGQSP